MKICFFANAASIHTHRWAIHYTKQGHDVTVFSLTPAEIPGVTVRSIAPDPNRRGRIAYLLCLPALRRALRRLQPDVLHAHYAGGYGLAAALAGFHPLVTTANGSDVLIVPRKSRLMGQVVRFSLRQADLVTSGSRHVTAVLEALGVSRHRILTLPYGIDPSMFHPGRRQTLPDRSPLVVSTRTLEAVYNVGLLIEALPEIFQQFPRATALIAGDGGERAKLEARVGHLGLADRVTFLGKRQPAEIAGYLSAADVFVSTSFSDGNNISLNEAMACGAFPVATDIPVNREWIVHGQNGFLTSPTDAAALASFVNRALADRELRTQAAAANWNIIQQRGLWTAAMETMEQRYRNLIHAGEPPDEIRAAAGVQR
jgi:glycosyltransferase involved in cell wall biosynthesis